MNLWRAFWNSIQLWMAPRRGPAEFPHGWREYLRDWASHLHEGKAFPARTWDIRSWHGVPSAANRISVHLIRAAHNRAVYGAYTHHGHHLIATVVLHLH